MPRTVNSSSKLYFTVRCIGKSVLPAVVILLFCGPAALSKTLELSYTFQRPTVESVEIDGQLFDRVVMSTAPNSGQVGHPALPAKGARILLPYGTEVESIEVIAGEKHEIGTGYLIEPVERPFSLSAALADIPPLFLDTVVYAAGHPIPEDRLAKVGVQWCHGYQILVLKLHPVEYVPATGVLSYYPELLIKVNVRVSGKSIPVLRNVAQDQREVSPWIDNPAEFSTYLSGDKQGASNYDMLIITPSSLAAAFQPLKDYHDTTGTLTEIHTLEQIGAADPHTIRDYIRQEYQDNGIQYVLLGGDDDLIPALDLYVVSWEGPDAVIEYTMPGDFYFSCLDGTFNYDGDALWGEPTDGEGGGEVDMFAEVHIGRASANSVDEVANLVNKTIAYLASEDQYLQKILLAGEQLRFGAMGEYGGYAMDEMVDGSEAHGFTTFGFPSVVYDIEKLYDLYFQPFNHWSASEIISRINNGVHIVDHLGHSSGHYAMRTDTSMIKYQLNNSKYCFVYAEGCSAGIFDLMDCWAEYMTVKLDHGAFGCIANSRLGLGARSTAHPVHVFNREFWDAIYRADEAKPQLGRAISDARADHAYHINDPGIRWTFYEINLFGDPAVAIKPVRCVVMTFPGDVPDQVPPQTEVTFDAVVTGIGEGEPVPGSGQLHYIIDQGDLVTVPMTEIAPNQYEATLPPLPCTSRIEFYVSAEESLSGRFYKPEPESAFTVVPVSEEIVIFEDDFETDKGWIISGGLWERGIPLGLGGEEQNYPVPDPTEGCNGPRVMGYNLSGDYENNLPETHVTSPAIDCTGKDNIHLRFCRWLGVEQPIYDKASVSVSSDGTNWTVIWENPAVIADLEWIDVEYDISAVADNQPTVYLRWTMGPTDAGLVYIGWNIDNVQVINYACVTWTCGDIDGSGGNANVADLTYLVDYIFFEGSAPPVMEAANVDGEGGINVADLTYLVDYLFFEGPELICGPIE